MKKTITFISAALLGLSVLFSTGLSAFAMLILCYFSGCANFGDAEQAQQVGKNLGTLCTIYP